MKAQNVAAATQSTAEAMRKVAKLHACIADTGTEVMVTGLAGGPIDAEITVALPAGNNNIGDVDIATLPNEGQQTMANSISVAIASDQSAVPVSGTVTSTPVGNATATLSNVGDSASSVTLLSANAARRGAIIFNDSAANLYVKFGTTASTTSFTHLMRSVTMYEIPFSYTGRIDGIWASDAGGEARITEITA